MKNPFKELLAERLDVLNMSGREFARRIGVSSTAGAYYLTANKLPTDERLAKIAEVLDVELGVLVDAVKASRRAQLFARAKRQIEAQR